MFFKIVPKTNNLYEMSILPSAYWLLIKMEKNMNVILLE